MATIVFDIGSSSVRAAAFHDDRMIPGTLARESMALSGEGEGDAREILALLEACLDRCLAALRRTVGPPRVAAIGFTSFAMSWLGVDGDGEPVTPVYTYCRRSPRASRSVEALRAHLAATTTTRLARLYGETGVPIHAAYVPSLLWELQEEEAGAGARAGGKGRSGGLSERVAAWQTVSSWVIGRWCGGLPVVPVSSSEASWTGLLRTAACDWHWELARELPLLRRHDSNDDNGISKEASAMQGWTLPPVRDFADPANGALLSLARPDGQGTTTGSTSTCSSVGGKRGSGTFAGDRWPELGGGGVRVFLGLGDGAAANLGSKCVDASRLCVTVGTSAALRVVLPSPCPRPHSPPPGPQPPASSPSSGAAAAPLKTTAPVVRLRAMGFCGADDSVAPELLAAVSESFRWGRGRRGRGRNGSSSNGSSSGGLAVEWGVVLKGPERQGTPRYPSDVWVEKLLAVAAETNQPDGDEHECATPAAPAGHGVRENPPTMLLAAHLCAGHAERVLSGDASEVIRLHRLATTATTANSPSTAVVLGFKRFQVNATSKSGVDQGRFMSASGAAGLRSVARAVPTAEFILQRNEESRPLWQCFEDGEYDEEEVVKGAEESADDGDGEASGGSRRRSLRRRRGISEPNVSFLFDASKGTGSTPAQWPPPPAFEGASFGYAGGLGPATIDAQLRKMVATVVAAETGTETETETALWVDMESGVRSKVLVGGSSSSSSSSSSSPGEKDVFDIGKCVECAKAALALADEYGPQRFIVAAVPPPTVPHIRSSSSSSSSSSEALPGEGGIPSGLWCYRIDSDRVLLGGALTDGGGFIEWLREVMGVASSHTGGEAAFAALMAEAAALNSDGGDNTEEASERGLRVLPFLGPERSVGWHDGASGAVAGLRKGTTRAQLLRAALEALALRLRAILERLEPAIGAAGGSASSLGSSRSGSGSGSGSSSKATIVASGGALAGNELWRQIIADATGRVVVTEAESAEATLVGAATAIAAKLKGGSVQELAAAAAALPPRPPLPLEPVSVTRPNTAAAARYERLYREQRAFYEQILAPSSGFMKWYA